jgi:hypothetical protein
MEAAMKITSTLSRVLAAALPLLLMTRFAPSAYSQTTPTSKPREAPTALVVVLPVALYNAQANVQEASDSSQAELSTQVLTAKLLEQLGQQLIAGERVAAAAASPEARATTGKQQCNVIVSCARQVGKALGAPWVVIAKVSKTSNLIWLFTGQLIHVPTGKIILDDTTELKGEPAGMVRAGSKIFAERVARTVRGGGVANNFPNAP